MRVSTRVYALGLVFFLPLTTWIYVRINFVNLVVENAVDKHLSRAANAGTFTESVREMDQAIEGAERLGLTHGSTSVLFPSPYYDIGAWYQTLHETRDQIAALGSNPLVNSTPTEMMAARKIRTDIAYRARSSRPDGSAVYPNVARWCYSFWGFVCSAFMGLYFLYQGHKIRESEDRVINLVEQNKRAA